MKKLLLAGLCSAAMLGASPALATSYTISFDEPQVHGPTQSENWGTIIDNEYGSDNLINFGDVDVTFWADRQMEWDANQADLFLTLFNSNATFPTEDPDLLVGQGNLGIIHERNGECNLGTNRCTDPDDRYDGSSEPHGGFIFVEFDKSVNLHSLDLADTEGSPDQQGEIAFFTSAGNMLGDWHSMGVTGNGGFMTQNFTLGQQITHMVIRMQGTGGFKNIAFSSRSQGGTQVSEPESIALMLFGLVAIYRLRAKKLARQG